MKAPCSDLVLRIEADPEAREKLMRIILHEADSNVLEFEGKRYVIDNYQGGLSYFYKNKSKGKR